MTGKENAGVWALHAADPSTTIKGAGDTYRYLATGAQTNDSYFMMEALVPPGGGPPPHIQTREEEGFYVLEGTVTFWTDDDEIEVGTGGFVHVPRGALHNFKNRTQEDARMLIWTAPAGIEVMFSKMAKDPGRLAEVAAEYGVIFPDAG
ncbi:MAG: cupin domain-containing protein [Longimicrobiales bacterium]